MTTSKLETLLGTTIPAWLEATTPASETGRTFQHVGSARVGSLLATSGDRTFWFDAPSGAQVLEYTATTTRYRWSVPLRVRLDLSPLSLIARACRVASDAITLIASINRRAESSWPTGVRYLQASGYEAEPGDGEQDVDLVIALDVITEETNT